MLEIPHSASHRAIIALAPAFYGNAVAVGGARAIPRRELGSWKYRPVARSRSTVVISAILSAGLHAWVLLGFNHPQAAPRPAAVAEEPIILMTMPELEEEEEKPVEALDEQPTEENLGVVVPMLADVPTIVPVDALVQPLDVRPVITANVDRAALTSIPTNIARSGNPGAKLGKVFDVSQLDRQPQAIAQPPPEFPLELRKIYTTSTVTMEFIITSKGDVVEPRAISSEERRFADSASMGVVRWKFRPGMKGGRPVNTRVRIAINFRVDQP
jgi:protein TonB